LDLEVLDTVSSQQAEMSLALLVLAPVPTAVLELVPELVLALVLPAPARAVLRLVHLALERVELTLEHLALARVVSLDLSVALLPALARAVLKLAHPERVVLTLMPRALSVALLLALERVALRLAHLAQARAVFLALSVDLLLDPLVATLVATDRAVLRSTQLAPHLALARVTTPLHLPHTLLAPLLLVPAALPPTTPRLATALKRRHTSPPYDQAFS
jgi:hypothetical protein